MSNDQCPMGETAERARNFGLDFPGGTGSVRFFRTTMDASQQEILDIFTRTRALLRGHFVLRSGLHSGHYFQCAQVCQDMGAVERLAELLVAKLKGIGGLHFTTVLAPAMGGLVIGQEVARQAKARYILA